jgi:hypothetical protein
MVEHAATYTAQKAVELYTLLLAHPLQLQQQQFTWLHKFIILKFVPCIFKPRSSYFSQTNISVFNQKNP